MDEITVSNGRRLVRSRSLVEESVLNDLVANEALRRGIVNQRALARWLIRTNKWDVTEDAVLSALRRSLPDAASRRSGTARDLLLKSHVNMRSEICILTMAKSPDSQSRLPAVLRAIDYTKGDTLRIIQGDRALQVIIDEANLSLVEQIVGKDRIEDRLMGLTEISVISPPESLGTPGILAIICNSLALRGINVLKIMSGVNEHFMFLPAQDAVAGFETLAAITSRRGNMPQTNGSH